MASRAKTPSWRVIAAGRGVNRGRRHFYLRVLVLAGLAGFVWAGGVLGAASQGETPGAAQAGSTNAAKPQVLSAGETLISANDLLFIQVFDVEQMTREYRVGGSGDIDFPLLQEPVHVAGLTVRQAAEVLAERCKKAGVLSRPQISVTLRESRVHAVAISGAVKTPQLYPVLGRISLLDLLSQAGGVADDAGSTVTVTRGEISRQMAAQAAGTSQAKDPPPGSATVTVNLQHLLDNSDPSSNLEVYPGDTVNVQRAGVVYVMGAVNRAGGYLLSDARQNMTVLKVVALAGYLSPFAKAKKALLLRPDPSARNGREEIPINLAAMLKGEASDRSLQNNDILFVPDSTALKALHRSADVAAYTAGLAVIYH